MLKTALKFYAIQKLSFYAGLAVLSLVAFFISATLSTRGEASRGLMAYNLENMDKQSDILNTLIVKYKADAGIWNSGTRDYYVNRNGLDLDLAKRRIKELSIANNIKSLSINLTNPAARDDISSLKFTKLIHSRMTMSLTASSDKDILKFVSGILNDLPGVLRFTNMQMTIESGDGNAGKIVSAKIEMRWQNLEDIS